MLSLAHARGLRLLRPEDNVHDWYTYINSRSEIDYFMSNHSMTDLRHLENDIGSDHRLIAAKINFDSLQSSAYVRESRVKRILHPRTQAHQIAAVINNGEWPQQHFMDVAEE